LLVKGVIAMQNVREIPMQPSAASDGFPKLKREMGPWMATALVVGNMVGSGVFLLPAALAAVVLVSGTSSLLAWAFTGIGAVLLAIVFGTLGRAYPRTGGPYAYARSAFGEFAGFWTAWGYWIAAWVGNAAIAVAFVGYLGVFWPALATDHLLAALVGIAAIWVLTAVNVAGVRQTGVVQVVTTVLKFLPLAAIGLIGLFFMKAGNFGAFAPHGLGWHGGNGAIGGITAAAALTLWAFIGLESATVPAEEVKNPERNIPRATVWGTLITTLVYVMATVAIIGILPATQLATSGSPFADAAKSIFGGSWNKWVALVALVSTFGALNGWILIQGRVPLAAARDGLFPKAFGRVSGTGRTPVVGLVVSSILLSGLMLLNYTKSLVDQFTFIILLATLTTLVPYAFAAAAEIVLIVIDPKRFTGRKLARDVVIASLGFGYAIWTIVGSGDRAIAKGFVLLMAGIPVYVFMKWRRGIERPVEAPRPEGRVRPLSVSDSGRRLERWHVTDQPSPHMPSIGLPDPQLAVPPRDPHTERRIPR
jgi:basic amino acid/polyamine antiporter, APA family